MRTITVVSVCVCLLTLATARAEEGPGLLGGEADVPPELAGDPVAREAYARFASHRARAEDAYLRAIQRGRAQLITQLERLRSLRTPTPAPGSPGTPGSSTPALGTPGSPEIADALSAVLERLRAEQAAMAERLPDDATAAGELAARLNKALPGTRWRPVDPATGVPGARWVLLRADGRTRRNEHWQTGVWRVHGDGTVLLTDWGDLIERDYPPRTCRLARDGRTLVHHRTGTPLWVLMDKEPE